MDSLFNALGFHRPKGEYMTKIEYDTACMFLMPRHYSGRIPNIKHAFGLFEDGVLQAVCTFGIPASPPLCRGIAGDKWKKNVIELNRLCRKDESTHSISHVITQLVILSLKGEPTRVVSSSGPTSRIAAFPLKRSDFYFP